MNEDAGELGSLRRTVYALLIVSSLATVAGRILATQSRDGHTPFFSANDRSRWSTISALVDEGTYAIDQVRRRPGWKSIDMVRHPDRQQKMRYYSSKPPLLPTLLAGPYWIIKTVTGASFATHPFAVARGMLLLTNLLPLAAFLILLTSWVEAHGQSDFGRIFVVGCACWGTLLIPFANSLNNHLPAAICVLITLLCVLRVWQDVRRGWQDEEPPNWLFAVAGLSAAFAAANELPALSFLVLAGLTLGWLCPKQTIFVFVPAVVIVAVAFFGTNYLAHDSFRPPYAHREPGNNWYDYPGSYWIQNRQGVDLGEPSRAVYLFHVLIGHHGFFSLTPIWILSLAGSVAYLVGRSGSDRYLAGATLGLWVVCVVFYVGMRPLGDRNYGGVASGFRWLFWLIPLWLMCLVPAADWLAERRWRQVLGLSLLAVSIVSATIPAQNPWTHPWIYRWLAGG